MIAARLRTGKTYALAALAFAAVYGLWLSIVSPRGEFPLNDDWAYAQSVLYMLDTGELRISQWIAPTAIFQVYWGSMFAWLADGFSFTALRWSTLVMSFVTCLALYDLLRQLDVPVSRAILGGLCLTVNPIFIYLSYTFMSDVFYLGAMLLSLSFYVRGIRRDTARSLLAGSLFAAIAYLSRQLGAVLPVAAAVALIVRDRRWRWRPLLLATVVPLLIIVGHTLWLQYVHGVTWGFRLNAVQNSLNFTLRPSGPFHVIWRGLLGLLYLGMFTLPAMAGQLASAPFARERLVRLGKVAGVWLVALGIVVLAMVILTGKPMPYLENVINREGLGPLTLAGQKTSITPDWVLWLVTFVAPLAGAAQGALWTEMLSNVRRGERLAAVLFGASLLMALPTAVVVDLWDEYLIVFVPAGLYLALRFGPLEPRGWLIALGTCAAMLVYGLVGVADHMAWNAARWRAGHALVARGVPPEAINGGFEWLGWYDFEKAWPVSMARGDGNELFAWMSVLPDRYWLAFEPLPGFTVADQVAYRVPPLGREGRIYVLESASP